MKKYIAPLQLNFSSFRMAVALAGLLLALAPLAAAGTIGISGRNLIVGTEAGDGNQSITASIQGTDLVISGVNFDLVTPGCSGLALVLCPLAGFDQLTILGADGDDAISLGAIAAPSFATLIIGGPGADVLVGSGGADTIFGDAGDDILIGGAGINCLSGGTGNNVVIGGGISCGAEPVILPLPRPAASAPEPGGVLLFGTALALLPMWRGLQSAGSRLVSILLPPRTW